MRFFVVFLILLTSAASAQTQVQRSIDDLTTENRLRGHLSFIASDELRGRNAGSPELDIAANYIRAQFISAGLEPAPGTKDYFQSVELVKFRAPASGAVTIGKDQFTLKDNMLVLQGSSFDWNGKLVYVGYGSAEDLQNVDVKGKVVLALAGARGDDNINKVYTSSIDKVANLKKAGAAGLVEVLVFQQAPWPALVNFFNKDTWGLSEGKSVDFPVIWVKPKDVKKMSYRDKQDIPGSVKVSAPPPMKIPGKNVAAMVKGSDPELSKEYIVLTAHYDHIGVDGTNNKTDSIFNGARDNAIGTVALIQAAKLLADHPPKRSVLLLAVTSEEKGLLGSRWYVQNPLVPLNKTVLNINCDGVGFNDVSRVTSISLGRTNMDDLLKQGAEAYGLSLGGDPDPREGFYERSDQVSFAKKGVPAIKLQPGVAQMDDDIFQYYHQPADEVGSLDMTYLSKFYKAYLLSLHLITTDGRKPAWQKGDKFEAAAFELYGR